MLLPPHAFITSSILQKILIWDGILQGGVCQNEFLQGVFLENNLATT